MATQCRNTNDNLVIGRGRVYIDLLVKGQYTGERYIGNTPDFSMSTSVDKLDHYTSEFGRKQKDRSINMETSRTLSMTSDNISTENVALYFAGVVMSALQSAQTGVQERINNGAVITRGRQYQLGVSLDYPMGQGGIKAGSFTIGYADASVAISTGTGDITDIPGVTVLPEENYELDYTSGALWIETDAPDILGDVQLVVGYDRSATNREVVISGDDVIEGALRFVSDNPDGENMSYYFPKVSFAPDGDYALKGDDWQQIGFTGEILQRDCNTKAVYAYRDTTMAATPLAFTTDLPTSKAFTTGAANSLSVVVQGGVAPLTYTWTKGGQAVSGNSATLAFANPQSSDAGAYKVVVRDATQASITSATCTVTVA